MILTQLFCSFIEGRWIKLNVSLKLVCNNRTDIKSQLTWTNVLTIVKNPQEWSLILGRAKWIYRLTQMLG